MDKYKLFWETIELCDWKNEGNDELVLMPVINDLSLKDDDTIFEFENQMSELLFALDTKALAEQYVENCGYWSEDGFLYSRCVALINGTNYYKDALLGKVKDLWTMEFESLLYIPLSAWARKHQKDEDDYPHIPPVSYETGSNVDAWQ